ncbi:hypothetical protein ACZ87_02704 [Candidatus Erwinia dacicola]|uniref:Uncharacterized protein n=1 Tax=Candidatus Erwinia dacicola TaxID=252393 RepID=A0A328TN33_9GAMM|nr:hypothetical protein ACZ87_02704 [Candidatus Erwinia dacicola]
MQQRRSEQVGADANADVDEWRCGEGGEQSLTLTGSGHIL